MFNNIIIIATFHNACFHYTCMHRKAHIYFILHLHVCHYLAPGSIEDLLSGPSPERSCTCLHDHNILYIKLRHYGINWVPLNWLINYLTGRQQFVKLDDEISNTLPISTGVPQGSILGPLLFILYINDLHMASDKFKAILYADDTTLVSTVSAFKQSAGAPDCKLLSENINFELTRINEWLALNINLNISKTKYIIFHFPQRNMALFNLELKLCVQHIECVRQFIFLGITIHETLNWDRYIDKIANKISRTFNPGAQ